MNAYAEAWLGSGAAPLVLASASPRRRDLLAGLGIECEVMPSDVAEVFRDGAAPAAEAERLARAKAEDVARRVDPSRLVLGADTVVSVDGRPLGKPADAGDARSFLERLSGRTHEVVTGVAVVRGDAVSSACACTCVRFVEIPPAVIAAYVATGEPYDKAGGYGAQAMGRAFIDSVDGCFFNVMGLPVSMVLRLIRGMERIR